MCGMLWVLAHAPQSSVRHFQDPWYPGWWISPNSLGTPDSGGYICASIRKAVKKWYSMMNFIISYSTMILFIMYNISLSYCIRNKEMIHSKSLTNWMINAGAYLFNWYMLTQFSSKWYILRLLLSEWNWFEHQWSNWYLNDGYWSICYLNDGYWSICYLNYIPETNIV
jgi:hypothetical protein